MESKNNKWKSTLAYVLIPLIILLLIFSIKILSAGQTKSLKYSEIVSYFKKNEVKEYSMDLGSGEMIIKLRNENVVRYTAPSVIWIRDDIKEYIKAYDQEHPDDTIIQDFKPAKDYTTIISTVLYLVGPLLIIVISYMMLKKNFNGLMDGTKSFGIKNSKIKNLEEDKRKTTFEDVAGAYEEKEELAEIVWFLKEPERFQKMGARIPKGVLLVGPPGTGKTLLARAIAGEAGVPFYPVSGSDFVELYVGMGASRVRDLFEQAKASSPCIVFIDEIDAVGRQRGAGGPVGGHDEREQTLNQLLVELDGFDNNSGVIVIAATNRADVLDAALLRPGRFDRQVVVSLPDVKGREDILKVHSKNKPFAPDVDLSVVAKSTAGFSGADLENLLNEAALMALKKGKKAITKEHLQEATVKVVMGAEKRSKILTEKEKELTAYHESGHAIVTYYCKTQDPVHRVSIIPTGMAGGYTMSLPSHDKDYRWKNEMLEEMIVCMGGRVAEDIVVGDISTGASQDIKVATQIANAMVTKYGMSDNIGPVLYDSDSEHNWFKKYSDRVASLIDDEISKLLSNAQKQAKDILTEHIDKLHKLAKCLLEREKIDGDEFKQLMEEDA